MITALVILLSQIALTRVMSVMVNYHSAFLILSVVMLGMASSAIAVYLGMKRQERSINMSDSVKAAYKSALATFLSVICFVFVVARDWGLEYQPIQLLLAAVLFFSWFFYSGSVVAIIFSHYARDMARLYWFDLMGASAGCLLIAPLLNQFTALNVLLLSAIGMSVSGWLLSRTYNYSGSQRFGAILTLILILIWGASTARTDWLRLRFVKGQDQNRVLWEKWNALARVSVTTEIPGVSDAISIYQSQNSHSLTPEKSDELRRLWQSGWGISRKFNGNALPALWLQLDSDAGTPILQNGVASLEDKSKLDFLSWDVTAVAYLWRTRIGLPVERAFVIGGGGGRDVLTSLAFDTSQVDVVELNPAVVEAVEHSFGSYSGRVYSHSRVNLTIGEARNELSRRNTLYDLIQMSMIDTWASSMAGSLVMTENNLYTQEAFDLYLARLKSDGVLSVSRWFDTERYGESARVAVLMANALRKIGIEQTENHVAILTSPGFLNTAVATLLLKKSPFTNADRLSLDQLCRERGYDLLWPQVTKKFSDSFDISGLLRLDTLAIERSPYDLSPPSDDRPFFFNIERPVQSWIEAWQTGDFNRGSRASMVLGGALLLMCFACFYFIIRPIRADQARHNESLSPRSAILPSLLYFGGIGLGFMLVELALIQRYIIFLGHPSYAISIVLFTLLMFGGIGSMLTEKFGHAQLRRNTKVALVLVIAGILLTAWIAPSLLKTMAAQSRVARFSASIALIAPLALFMGMIYPLGVRELILSKRSEQVPWMWGINGISGVIGSVLGMLLAMSISYTAVLLTAAMAYSLTLLSVWFPQTNASKITHQSTTTKNHSL